MRFVHRYEDRHGAVRHYFRRAGCKSAVLPGLPGSDEFMEAYGKALKGEPAKPKSRAAPGSLGRLIELWYGSATFVGLRKTTQRAYRNITERLREEHGAKGVATLQPVHIRHIIAARAATPHAANRLLKIIRALMDFATDEEMRPDNPAIGVKRVRTSGGGFHTWTEVEILAYEARWPLGTRERLALALLLFTAQRRGDVVRMGRQHERRARIEVKQEKTGTEVSILIHPELRAALDAGPCGDLTYLVTHTGASFTSAGFGNYFRECCRKAGIPDHCSAHGLRKAMYRRLSERGVSTKGMGAVGGHKTLGEIERYSAAASQQIMADAAIRSLDGTERETGNG